ncbi:MAG: hopanoid transporter HpnN [Rhodoplanes sp.]
MLVSTVIKVVSACVRWRKAVIAFYLTVGAASAYYAATHFRIDTNMDRLMSPTLDWRVAEKDFEQSFPGRFYSILVVVDASTQELVTRATARLAERLKQDTGNFYSVEVAGGGAFFEQNGLLFQPLDELEATTKGLAEAAPLVRTTVSDPSLRGLAQVVTLLMSGVRGDLVSLDTLAGPFTRAAETTDRVMAGAPASFSWQALLPAGGASSVPPCKLINVRPVLDFSALEPGSRAAGAIRLAARDLDLEGAYRARVRLTGPVAMADEEFATVRHGALRDTAGTIVMVLVILWLALGSGKLIAAVFLNMFVGLAATAALGLMMVDALNLISIAFAVLFVGLGVDFGIQFTVRYRAERHELDDLGSALRATAQKIGAPLTLAAAAVAAGFLSFTPTDYRGISELGIIAGPGMLVAFLTSITFLPALLALLKPGGEPAEIGYRALAPIDRFLERHRFAVVGGTGLVTLLGAPLLLHLTFDFNPINLRNPNVESVSTLLSLRDDPDIGENAISVLTPSLDAANAAAEQLRQLPEAGQALTLASFVPDRQKQKLALVAELEKKLGPALQAQRKTAPTDAENVAALRKAATFTEEVAGARSSPGAEAARRFAGDLRSLAEADEAARARVAAAFLPPLETILDGWRKLLQAGPVTLESLPPELKDDWITKDGRYRVDVRPNGDPNDTEVLRAFATATLAVFPNATGVPISILKAGETIVAAFIQAGAYALGSIAVLLWIVLRRFADVLLTLLPLVLAGVLTLEICVLIGLPLNFANIIALPVLLGVGVAFKIYYIMAWRAGQTNLLQSSLTRGVIWSALTTATAFGSLWMSSHPGTSSMGELLALSLVTTMCAAVLFQPALMGKPRQQKS